jgi:hypothetical protein
MSTHPDRSDHPGPSPELFIADPTSFVSAVRLAARQYGELGLRVVRLRPMSKTPLDA